MATERPPEELVYRIFLISMVGIGSFIAAVFLFIIL